MLAVGLALLTAGAFYASRTLNVLGLGAGGGHGPRRERAAGHVLPSPPWPWGPRGLPAPWAAASPSWGSCARTWRGASWGRTSGRSCRRAVLVGAVLMLLADIISRTLLAPNEIPVGIVAAVIGAPYFLYLLAKS